MTYYGVTWSLKESHGNLMKKGTPSLTQGEVVTFLFLVVSLMPNIAFMVPNLSTLFQVYASSDRLVELMDVPITEPGTEVPFSLNKGQIDVMNVEFAYPTCDEIQVPVLKGVSINVSND